MNNSVHDELIESLAKLRRGLPSMRLGQLVANMATVVPGAVPGAIWEAEDHELLGAIRWQLEQLANCNPAKDAKGAGKGASSGIFGSRSIRLAQETRGSQAYNVEQALG